MPSDKIKPRTIDEYIALAPQQLQERLIHLHECICSAAPGSEEGLKWNMPAYSSKRILVTWACFKNHIGFYPTPAAVTAFADRLKPYKSAEGSVQFPHDQVLPLGLIGEMTRFRVRDSEENDAKWKV